MPKIFKSEIVYKEWGGDFLSTLKGIKLKKDDLPVGETIEIFGEEFPYLVKFIDTKYELSIQVHPDDHYAKKEENSTGKTECWLILEANEDSGVYLGLRPNISKKQLEEEILLGNSIDSFLNFIPVKSGDFFFVPAGTIHAIGKGILLAEVQQNSGITYRVWDWNRIDKNGKSRELHLKKSLDVINFTNEWNMLSNFQIKSNLFQKDDFNLIATHECFKVFLIKIEAGIEWTRNFLMLNSPLTLLNFQNVVYVNGIELNSFSAIFLNDKLENCFNLKINSSVTTFILAIY